MNFVIQRLKYQLMRILYVTTIGATMGFFKSLIKELIDDGHVVDIATNRYAANFR